MRVSERFATLRSRGEKALITYITGGDPNADVTATLLREIDRAGADVIELGIPRSACRWSNDPGSVAARA